jgi:hypothetical protein
VKKTLDDLKNDVIKYKEQHREGRNSKIGGLRIREHKSLF